MTLHEQFAVLHEKGPTRVSPFLVPMMMLNTGEHPDYHTTNDTWDRINYPKIEKITKLIYLSAREVANSAARPKFIREATARATSSNPDQR